MNTQLTKAAETRPEHVEQGRFVSPVVDIYENIDEVLLTADLPGVTTDTLKVHWEKGNLTIEGARNLPDPQQTSAGEIVPWNYRRTFRVPGSIAEKKIRAEFSHGVLHLHLPKSEASKPRRIQVKSG